jgi:hypothetical protein
MANLDAAHIGYRIELTRYAVEGNSQLARSRRAGGDIGCTVKCAQTAQGDNYGDACRSHHKTENSIKGSSQNLFQNVR